VPHSRELAGNTATTDPRSQRIRASRRGGQITARARSPWYKRRPARTRVLPVPRVPDGLTIALIRSSAEREGTEAIMPDNREAERMNRTIKDATVKRYHYDSHDQLRTHLHLFVDAYNHARRLKTLRGLTPYEAICKAWTDEPARFTQNPHHQIPGPNT
jgi:hypothetical protein